MTNLYIFLGVQKYWRWAVKTKQKFNTGTLK